MALIAVNSLVAEAEKRGFRVRRYTCGEFASVEIFAPEHVGLDAVWHNGSCYSACQIVIDDAPSLGYGYNGWFHGPWHKGYCRTDDFGVQRLREHPAMAGAF